MINTLIAFGTRPEAIKMAPLVLELKARPEFCCTVCVTAQHRQMLDQALDAFGITPDIDLDVMRPRQSLTDVTAAALRGMEDVIAERRPDIVLVHGDTATTFACALAAYYRRTDVGHVEAGLRTLNKYSPFPEEMYRQMTDRLADMLFAPTELSRLNLLREGRESGDIFVTGNTAVDALRFTVREDYSHPALDGHAGHRLLLLTAHRRENLGDPMYRIFGAIKRIVNEFRDVRVIYPVHLNPSVREIADGVFGSDSDRISLIEPLDVCDFHNFISRAYMILTDSGGIQEEAPSLGKPVLVVRDTTERPEGVEAGTLKLVGTDEDAIYRETKLLLEDRAAYEKMSHASNPYGDGFASKRIADSIIARYGSGVKSGLV
ncbi:MAG: UDP-N-acetylglucosamine 2-epimerase (non-hydrolyzing) [Oscillospiraceae bacterium]|jgi:UDP-N-acetylglucosamine 2-epimerase (non-hydrolysing)|nr:UDP-N-acetylglucosamine 2-epimerase (non-hydrolyzing) [Oscillospiraceae bacterium]